MKTLGVAILFVCVLMQTFNKGVILVEFLLNRDYIAKNLCINKARPQMKCGGKCQLMKRLAAEEEQDRNNRAGRSVKVHFNDVNFTDHLFNLEASYLSPNKIVHYSTYTEKIYSSPHFSLFHPPGV
jgi:hypothetical protein